MKGILKLRKKGRSSRGRDVKPPEPTDWQVCWKVDLHFHSKFTGGNLFCLVCNKTTAYASGTYRSTFWQIARCWSGHCQQVDGVPVGAQAGICAKCSQKYLLDILRGKFSCKREGCKRQLRYNKQLVAERLKDDPVFLRSFTTLTEKFQTFECQVCFEQAEHLDDVTTVAPQCNHDPNVCKGCIMTMFEEKVKTNKLKEIVCPDPACRKELPPENVRRYLSSECLPIYEKQLTIAALSKQPMFRWCKCGSGQIHTPGGARPEWRCAACGHRNCFLCPKNMGGPTCEHLHAIDLANRHQHDQQRLAAMTSLQNLRLERRENTTATEAEKARCSKRCPAKTCGAWIQRIDGCSHTKCPLCGVDFCWSCKVIWKSSNALHLNTCKVPQVTTKTTFAALDKSDYKDGWNVDEGYDESQDARNWLIEGHR